MLKATSEDIEFDLAWLKNELRGLTRAQRRIILQKYVSIVGKYCIGMVEFKAFMTVFLDVEEGDED